MFTEIDLSVEHVLMFVIIVFLLYHLIGGCSCIRDGFSVGGELCPPLVKQKDCPPSENYSAWVDKNSSCTCPPGQNFAYHTDQNRKEFKRCDHNAGVLPICRAQVNCSADRDHRMPQGVAFDCANIRQDPNDTCDKWVDFHGFQCKNNPSSSNCTIDLDKPRCLPLKPSE